MQSQTLTAYRNPSLKDVLGITREALNDYSPVGVVSMRNLLSARLKSMKRLARKPNKRQHWAYDINRVYTLSEAFKLECIAVDRLHPVVILRAGAALYGNSKQRLA